MKFFQLFIIFSLAGLSCMSQQNNNIFIKKESQLYFQPTDSLKSFYDENIISPENSLLGKTYHVYFNPTVSKPFLNNWFSTGTIYINGKVISNLSLAYDDFREEFVLNANDIGAAKQINLNKSIIDSVTLVFPDATYHLIKIVSKNDSILSDGFYEVSSFNKFKLYTKYIAELYTTNSIDSYTQKMINTLELNNSYYPINRKKQLLSLFPEKKKKIKRKLSATRNTYKKLSRVQLIDLLTYIDSL